MDTCSYYTWTSSCLVNRDMYAYHIVVMVAHETAYSMRSVLWYHLHVLSQYLQGNGHNLQITTLVTTGMQTEPPKLIILANPVQKSGYWKTIVSSSYPIRRNVCLQLTLLYEITNTPIHLVTTKLSHSFNIHTVIMIVLFPPSVHLFVLSVVYWAGHGGMGKPLL